MRMVSFIRVVDENAWTSVEEGWTTPCDEEGKTKHRSKWSSTDLAASNANQKALNSIQNAVTMEVFVVISMCSTAKEAWEVLMNTYEGNSKVKKQRLQQLTTRFEELKMDENETISNFHGKILSIPNESFSLGEKILEEKLVRKVMHALPERFDYKITVIDEARDVSDMKLEELIGSLRTFEMNLRSEKFEKRKSLAFVADSSSKNKESQKFDTDELVESFALFTKNFGKAFNRYKRGMVSTKDFKMLKTIKLLKPRLLVDLHPDRGYSAMNVMNKQNKSFNVSHNDEETDDSGSYSDDDESIALISSTDVLRQKYIKEDPLKVETDTDTEKDPVAFTAKVEDVTKTIVVDVVTCEETDSDTEELDESYLAENYEMIYKKCLAMLELNKSLSTQLNDVSRERDDFKEMYQKQKTELDVLKQIMESKMGELEHQQKLVKMMNSGTDKLDEILGHGCDAGNKTGLGFQSKGWVPKTESWYLDSGCSKHMTEEEKNLENLQKVLDEGVTFGDGARAKVIGTGTLNVPDKCVVKNGEKEYISGKRSSDNCYIVTPDISCLKAQIDITKVWHQKLGHTSLRNMKKLIKTSAIQGIPKLVINTKDVSRITTSRILELIHMDLMGPMQVESLGRKKYVLLEKDKEVSIKRIPNDHGREFKNADFDNFCEMKGITHEYSAPKTPQQNGVVERKNRTLQDMVRTMMKANNIATNFWAEAMNTAYYIINRVYLRPKTSSTPYEIWRGRKPSVKHLHIYGCTCYILNDRSSEGIFLGYSDGHGFRVYNKNTETIQESTNVTFDEESKIFSYEEEVQAVTTEVSSDVKTEVSADVKTDSKSENDYEENRKQTTKSGRVEKNHSQADIIGGLNDERKTRGVKIDFQKMIAHIAYMCYLSKVEQKSIKEALQDEFWIAAMQEELLQFERNKARLVAQRYSQVEGVDFEETFAPVTRLESVRLLLALACAMTFKLYQMDVKSVFLNGDLEEEVLRLEANPMKSKGIFWACSLRHDITIFTYSGMEVKGVVHDCIGSMC
ncbi:uncharacterized protein LOC131023403 [Salvia miltiorrhiza]|uniref:uncharacterized protein LOC131023403 n=1 Tax=Salvia miltiorrhiza TaxID=226208 RepID=UPI0025AD4D5C|nr:uncharacterized protein LOC131023403 [Salvia miltiorrhiza]